jgi:hypothetical protein
MVYSSRFVVCILVNGQIQKELADGTVPIRFGTQYSIRFRNKHNRRAVVKFTIDGEDVSGSGSGYVINANSAIDIHRYADKDVSFKFVSLDSPEAIDFGKNGPNLDKTKGVIEARFYLEKELPKAEWRYYWPPHAPWMPTYPVWRHPIYFSGNVSTTCSTKPNYLCSMPQNYSSLPQNAANLAEGCTVQGSASGQMFTSTYLDIEQDFVTIRLVLKGIKDSEMSEVSQNASYCVGCGAKKSRETDNFCGICGKKF